MSKLQRIVYWSIMTLLMLIVVFGVIKEANASGMFNGDWIGICGAFISVIAALSLLLKLKLGLKSFLIGNITTAVIEVVFIFVRDFYYSGLNYITRSLSENPEYRLELVVRSLVLCAIFSFFFLVILLVGRFEKFIQYKRNGSQIDPIKNLA